MSVMERRADIVWTGDLKGAGKLRVASGAFPEQTVTFDARTGSADGKTSPEELIAAAHATCFSMAFSNTLATNGAAPEQLDVSATCTLERLPTGLRITAMELVVRGRVGNIDETRFRELAQLAESKCPVSNALRGNVEITVRAELAPAGVQAAS
jgi:osmotically inducible protein OsmC